MSLYREEKNEEYDLIKDFVRTYEVVSDGSDEEIYKYVSHIFSEIGRSFYENGYVQGYNDSEKLKKNIKLLLKYNKENI